MVWDSIYQPEFRLIAAALVFIGGLIVGVLVGRLFERILESIGVPSSVEGTTVERTARKFGTSTVSLIGQTVAWTIYIVAALIALEVAGYFSTVLLLVQAGDILPNLLLALFIVFIGLLAGDKAEVMVSERLRGVKLPEIGIIPTIVRYTVVMAAVLLALAQVGIAVTILIVVFGAYIFTLVVISIVAFHHLLTSAAAGMYLLLNQPYGIGDHVEVGPREGIVQEVDIFVTRIEDENREHIVPNHLVLREGAVVVRR